MNNLIILIISFFCLQSVDLYAQSKSPVEQYKIMAMNDGDILVNGKRASIGLIFDDKAVITWKKEKQAMRVVNLKSKKQYLMFSFSMKRNNLTAYEVLTSNRHLSTHTSDTDVKTLYSKLTSLFDEQYLLMDTIMIATDVSLDDTHYLQATYEYGDAQITKKLEYTDGHIVIDRSLFDIENKHLEPRDIFLVIEYKDEKSGMMMFVKADIELRLVPEKL